MFFQSLKNGCDKNKHVQGKAGKCFVFFIYTKVSIFVVIGPQHLNQGRWLV